MRPRPPRRLEFLAGARPAYNNNAYAGLALCPDGTAYLGVIPGRVALGTAPLRERRRQCVGEDA